MDENPYDLAKELRDHEDIHGVRASERRLTVVHAPEDRHTEKIPESAYDHIHAVIAGTVWQTEYQDPGRNAEKHTWVGGIFHDPVLSGREQPAGVELQYHLVK